MSIRCRSAFIPVVPAGARYPQIRAVFNPSRRSVVFPKETSKGYFEFDGEDGSTQIQAVGERQEAPIWREFTEQEAVGVREALMAFCEPQKPAPVADDERERFPRIIEDLSLALGREWR